jgi:hypothetical protein
MKIEYKLNKQKEETNNCKMVNQMLSRTIYLFDF